MALGDLGSVPSQPMTTPVRVAGVQLLFPCKATYGGRCTEIAIPRDLVRCKGQPIINLSTVHALRANFIWKLLSLTNGIFFVGRVTSARALVPGTACS